MGFGVVIAAAIVCDCRLLANGWNASVSQHWPLHNTSAAGNTTAQCLSNLPILQTTFAALDTLAARDDACRCEIAFPATN